MKEKLEKLRCEIKAAMDAPLIVKPQKVAQVMQSLELILDDINYRLECLEVVKSQPANDYYGMDDAFEKVGGSL